MRCPACFVGALITALAILLAPARAPGCSPAGHAFVAAAAVHRLAASRDPAVQKLARILHNYRWVVYCAAEGPDVVQNDRDYHAAHWFPLYRVNYEHPERFDLRVAQPYYNALLRHAYAADYGVTPEDISRSAIALARQPNRQWNEVGLAYACGYITHLISDYFCHAPAKLWWDHEPKLSEAVNAVCKEDSYGVIQEFYAVMLWERFAKQYGQPENPVADFRRHLAIHHVDNAILPYCALAGSKTYYRDWPPAVLAAVDPAKYDGCAVHMLHRGGKSSGDCVEFESRRVHRMLDRMGLPFDRAVEESNRLTGWQQTYARVITMIDEIWSSAAGQIGLREPGKTNVVLAADQPDRQVLPIVLAVQRGSQVNLALQCDWAATAYETRKRERGPLTGWGQQPSGARFELGILKNQGRGRPAILTDGPYKLGPGSVRGRFVLRLPATADRILFRAQCGQEPKNTDKSDGVTFQVLVVDAHGAEHDLFHAHVRREFRPASADLTPFAGQQIELVLVADSGPRDDYGWDTGAWLEPSVSIEAR